MWKFFNFSLLPTNLKLAQIKEMKKLENYTTDELKAELKRRQDIERRERAKNTSHAVEFAYVSGVIVDVDDTAFCRQYYRVEIDEADRKRVNLLHTTYDMKLDRKVFSRKSLAPKLGDRVKIKSRKSKRHPNGFGLFSEMFICEIIN
jgi:hypothetical protein